MLTFPPDQTFLIQLVSFFLLLIVLNRLLFAPFLELLAERAQRTEGDRVEAERQREEAEAVAAKVSKELGKARTEATAEMEAVRRTTKEEEGRLFDTAKQAASERLAELRVEIDSVRAEAESALQEDSRAMASEMAAVLLEAGRKG